jgi:transcriptional regulator with XRE-family HTH domain
VELHEAAGLSQHALAKTAGVHLSIVFKIEQGTSMNPRVGSAVALAEALGIGVDYRATCPPPFPRRFSPP